jgi:hypothetical protein
MIEFVRGRGSRARTALLAALFMLGAAFGTVRDASAQTPSAAEMEAFRNLPADQQQAILEELGGGASSGVRRDRDLSSPETVRPRTVDGTTDRESESASGLAAGTYLVRAYGYQSAAGSYTLTEPVQ